MVLGVIPARGGSKGIPLNKENFIRMFDKGKVSPPFYGNYMTFFCEKS
tara:strand:- start:32 stop:175 length:144 start_codon:yes stop_codon:yes gene_type:complete